MAILAGFFSILFSRFLSRWWASIAALLAIAAYTLLVGSGPAVVRAAVMSGLGLIAVQIGRSSGGVTALLPAGNSPDDLPREALQGLTAVLLGSQDAPEEWQGVGVPLTLSPSSIPPGGWAHIQTDGERMWVEVEIQRMI